VGARRLIEKRIPMGPKLTVHELHGGGASPGGPTDAILRIRSLLEASFLANEPGWDDNLRAAIEARSRSRKAFERESEEQWRARLRSEVIAARPAFVRAIERRVRLGVFLIGHARSKIVRDEILPRLDYWHHRTGEHVDIVCIGFSSQDDQHPDGRAFAQMVRMLQDQLDWSYSGETDLIAFNVRFRCVPRMEAFLDLSETVSLTLERALEDKAITSVAALVEDLVRAGQGDGKRGPAWLLSDAYGKHVAGSTLKRLLLSLLPKEAMEGATKGLHFYIRDLQRRRAP